MGGGKSERIAAWARHWEGNGADPRFVGYFALFNASKYYEAHDVLEDFWLEQRHGAHGDLFKGLIQLAGAYLLMRKRRSSAASRVFKASIRNLEKYSGSYEGFVIEDGARLARAAVEALERGHSVDSQARLLRSPPGASGSHSRSV